MLPSSVLRVRGRLRSCRPSPEACLEEAEGKSAERRCAGGGAGERVGKRGHAPSPRPALPHPVLTWAGLDPGPPRNLLLWPGLYQGSRPL